MTPFQIVSAYLGLITSPIPALAVLASDWAWSIKIMCIFIVTALAANTYCRIRDYERTL